MSLFESVAESAIGSASARFSSSALNTGFNTAERLGGDILRGDALSLSRHVLNTGIANTLLGGLLNPVKQALYWSSPTPMFAGLSPSEAKRIHRQSASTRYGNKNWFLLQVSSQIGGDVSEAFNLMASDIEYAPSTITGDIKKIGSASIDSVQSGEPVDLTLTTMDDARGSIKTWFNSHVQAAVHTDGTLGLPAQYAIRIRIAHHVIQDDSGAYADVGLFRPVNMPLSLSRKEDGLQEIGLQFRQLDTFMRP